MIHAANIISIPTQAKPAVSPAKTDSHSAKAAPSGETRKKDRLAEPTEWKDNPGTKPAEDSQADIPNTSRRTQPDDPAASREEKSPENQTKDTVDFQQYIAAAILDVTNQPSPETTVPGEIPVDADEPTAAPLITPVTVEVAAGQVVATDVPAANLISDVPVVPAGTIPTPSTDAAAQTAVPQSQIAAPQADEIITNESIESAVTNTNTSGRPESTPIPANVSQAEIHRRNVEATDSSTAAKTAAPEINPNSGDSGTVTPGRPVVPLPTSDIPQTDVQVAKPTETTTVTLADGKPSENPSGDTPDSSFMNDPQADAKAQAFVPPASEKTPAESPVDFQINTHPDQPEKLPGDVKVSDADQRQDLLPTAITSQGPEITAPAATTGDGVAVSTVRGVQVADQITAHIQMRRDDLGEEMAIRLDPPELGKVRIQFRSENGELAGVIRTDNAQTHAELQREASSLMQRLNEAGVQIKTLDVQMNDMSQQGRGEQSFAQAQNAYSMFQQHNGGGRGYGYHADTNEPHSGMQDDTETWNSQTGQYVSDSALNVML